MSYEAQNSPQPSVLQNKKVNRNILSYKTRNILLPGVL